MAGSRRDGSPHHQGPGPQGIAAYPAVSGAHRSMAPSEINKNLYSKVLEDSGACGRYQENIDHARERRILSCPRHIPRCDRPRHGRTSVRAGQPGMRRTELRGKMRYFSCAGPASHRPKNIGSIRISGLIRVNPGQHACQGGPFLPKPARNRLRINEKCTAGAPFRLSGQFYDLFIPDFWARLCRFPQDCRPAAERPRLWWRSGGAEVMIRTRMNYGEPS